MSYQFYKFLHLSGIFMIMMSLGAVALHVMNGGTKEFAHRKFISIFHGVGLLVAFVAGFGLLARLGVSASSGWVLAKIAIWVILSGAAAFMYRKPEQGRVHWVIVFILAACAAYLAQNKPF
jgi:hypothetical protein